MRALSNVISSFMMTLCVYCIENDKQNAELDKILEFANFDITSTVEDEGPALEENWVNEAVLEVAYYLRSHKFNDFDRRLPDKDAHATHYFFAKFPEPRLRSLHWEVSYNCEDGFTQCLEYLYRTIQESKLKRSMDTVYLQRQNCWTWEHNFNEILNADDECRNIFDGDWQHPEPFQGPLQRFEFRVTASYYMCKFTMEERSELASFGEHCDNFANCLVRGEFFGTQDSRAQDEIPFACARYSFCPDPCCPVKQLPSVMSAAKCGNDGKNPCCDSRNSEISHCSLNGSLNTDFASITLNRWNLTCDCDQPGYAWDSRFADCVDIDECELGTHSCNVSTEHCFNLKGGYNCGCIHYMWFDEDLKECVRMTTEHVPNEVALTTTAEYYEKKREPTFWGGLSDSFQTHGTLLS